MNKQWLRAFLFAGIMTLIAPGVGFFCVGALFLWLILQER